MMKNVGTFDRILRGIVGVLVLSMLFVVEGDLRWLGYLGLIPIATAVVGWCPAYQFLGWDSCPDSDGRLHHG